MSKFRFVNIIDSIIISIILFFISFAIVQFFIGDYLISLFVSVFLTLALLIVIKLISNSRYNAKQQALNNAQIAENNAINFQTYSENKKIKLIYSLIPEKYSKKIVGNHIEYFNKNNVVEDCDNQEETEKNIIIVENNIEKINKNTLLNIIKSYINKTKKLIIFCNICEDDAKNLISRIKNIKIIIIDKFNFYDLCCKNDIKIEENLVLKKDKITIKSIFKNFFAKNHFKSFLLSGLILLFASLIIPFKTYYLIFGITSLVFALICKLPKKTGIKKDWLD